MKLHHVSLFFLALAIFASCASGSDDSLWQPAGNHIRTRWAKEVSPENSLPEYPRPQMAGANGRLSTGSGTTPSRRGTARLSGLRTAGFSCLFPLSPHFPASDGHLRPMTRFGTRPPLRFLLHGASPGCSFTSALSIGMRRSS